MILLQNLNLIEVAVSLNLQEDTRQLLKFTKVDVNVF